jgi:tetratricopeptide (TPR) repeat protein
MDWLETRDAERALRLTAALGRFWYLRGFYVEGCERLGAALAAAAPAHRTQGRGRALDALAELHILHGDLNEAVPLVHESLAIARELRDLQAVGRAYWNLARIAARRPETHPATAPLLEHGLAIARAVGDQPGVALGLNLLGRACWVAGDRDRGREHWEESRATYRSMGLGGIGLASCLCHLARSAVYQGKLLEAQHLLEESFAMSRELGDAPTVCDALEVSAVLAAAEDTAVAAERALRLAAASQALQVTLGALSDWFRREELEQMLVRARAMLGAAVATAAWAAGEELSPEQAIAEALGPDSPRAIVR